MENIKFEDKQVFQFINLPERQKITAGNMNELKQRFNEALDHIRSLNVLTYEGMPLTSTDDSIKVNGNDIKVNVDDFDLSTYFLNKTTY